MPQVHYVDHDAMVKCYTEHGLDVSALCERFSVNHGTVIYHLRLAGVWHGVFHSRGEYQPKRELKPKVTRQVRKIAKLAARTFERYEVAA
jgi:hypothetical protein